MCKKNKKNILGEIKYPVGIQLISCEKCERVDKETFDALSKVYLEKDYKEREYEKLIQNLIVAFQSVFCIVGRKIGGGLCSEDETDKFLANLESDFNKIKNYKYKGEKC